jgi:ubiquinone/menaquinone biosynthesis C-methylase UbiE
MLWIITLVAVAALVAALVWWLVFRTEGIYLGRRTVIWLYDIYARRYDDIKQWDPETEEHYLARPILDRLTHVRAPLALDVATGTGRLPLALLERPSFQGRVIGLDLSRKMLTVAAERLAPFGSRVWLLHHPAESLPFPDNTFDLVTCLEALEFMMNPREVLCELVRVVRPGGLLVLTNRQGADAKMMPGRTFSHDTLERLLRDDFGMTGVKIEAWQMDYKLVWATKAGHSQPAGPHLLEEIWRCPQCAKQTITPTDTGWRCDSCAKTITQHADGVISL